MTRDGLRPRVVVAVDTDEGITGWGEAYITVLTAPSRLFLNISVCRSRARIRDVSNDCI